MAVPGRRALIPMSAVVDADMPPLLGTPRPWCSAGFSPALADTCPGTLAAPRFGKHSDVQPLQVVVAALPAACVGSPGARRPMRDSDVQPLQVIVAALAVWPCPLSTVLVRQRTEIELG